MSWRGAFARREVRVSVLAGAVAALLVVVAGAALAVMSAPKWTAESVLVVLPSAALDTSDSAAYYETLSRGQIVATFAEVADNLRFQDQAEQNLQLSDAQRAGVTTTVSVVPDTSVILVRTTAGSAAVAEQVADATTKLATTYLAGLSEPYRTDLVHGADGTATASGTSPTTMLALAVVVGLIAGVGVQQAVYHLMVTVRGARQRKARPTEPPDPGPAVGGPPDASTLKGGTRDSGTRDSGTRDSGTRDSGTRDSGTRDGGTRDSGTRDETSDRERDSTRARESMVGPHGS